MALQLRRFDTAGRLASTARISTPRYPLELELQDQLEEMAKNGTLDATGKIQLVHTCTTMDLLAGQAFREGADGEWALTTEQRKAGVRRMYVPVSAPPENRPNEPLTYS